MSASKSDSRTSQRTFRDSFNKTYNAVNNLSDVGNTTITFGGATNDGGENELVKLVLPYSLAALGALVLIAIFGAKA